MASRFLKPKRRILVVDDDVDIREFLCDLLASWNCLPIPAASGCEAIRILQQRSIDVVMLDLAMPIMDGAETLREIKRLAPDLPVIMMSALITSELWRYFSELGAQSCVAKPMNRERLAATLLPYLPEAHA